PRFRLNCWPKGVVPISFIWRITRPLRVSIRSSASRISAIGASSIFSVPAAKTMKHLESPQAIRTIFFDAGFTLLRTVPSLIEICQDVCRREGLHLETQQIADQLPAAEAYFSSAIKANRRTWASEEDIVRFWTGYYQALLRPFIAADNAALLER